VSSLNEPRLSVIVPAHRCAGVLPRSLGALRASDLPRDGWELIVVDDASRDDTPDVARRYADRVVRLMGSPSGPAYARNRGVEAARGEIVVFIDADVCVHPDTLRGFQELFDREPGLGAAFGAYDTAPAARGVVSQYRNLVHHYCHSLHAGEAETFWAGCGAVRREAFLRVGGFDELAYRRPQVEDIELGYRLRERGYRILLDPSLQATHLKRWTLASVLVTDLRDRGIPWVQLLLDDSGRARRTSLNVRPEEKFATGLTGLAGLLVVVALVLQAPHWLGAALALVGMVLVLNAHLLRWFVHQRGLLFGVLVVPLRLLYYGVNGTAVLIVWAQRLLQPPLVARSTPVVTRVQPPGD
jgi:hypothetical protein